MAYKRRKLAADSYGLLIFLLLFTITIDGKSSGGSRGSSSSSSSGSRSSSRSSSYRSSSSSYGGGGSGGAAEGWKVVGIIIGSIFGFIIGGTCILTVLSLFCENVCHTEIIDDDGNFTFRSLEKPLNTNVNDSAEENLLGVYPTHPLPPSQRGDTGFRKSSADKGPPIPLPLANITVPPPAYDSFQLA